MKTLLIIYDIKEDSYLVEFRKSIASFGEVRKAIGNTLFVRTESSIQDVYHKLVSIAIEGQEFFVVETTKDICDNTQTNLSDFVKGIDYSYMGNA